MSPREAVLTYIRRAQLHGDGALLAFAHIIVDHNNHLVAVVQVDCWYQVWVGHLTPSEWWGQEGTVTMELGDSFTRDWEANAAFSRLTESFLP